MAGTDRYVRFDKETGERYDGSRSQDEWNKNLEVLSKFQASSARKIKELEEFEQGSYLRTFNEEADKIIEEIQGLEGDLYTQEGKNAGIREKLKELASDIKISIDGHERERQETLMQLKEKLDSEINKYTEQLSPSEIAELNIRYSDLQGTIKGSLYRWNDIRTLQDEFHNLADQAKHDKVLSRFLENNYYLFLDKASTLSISEVELNRFTYIIDTKVKEIKNSQYSDKQLALIKSRDRLDRSGFHISDSRLIDKHLQGRLRRYS